MAAWKEKWGEMSWYRRILLVVTAVMVVAFGVATPLICIRVGFEFDGALLRAREEGGIRYYEGRVDGRPAAFVARPGGLVEYRWGEYVYGPYEVAEDPSAVPADRDWTTGIEIRRGEQVLFRGGYDPEWALSLYREDGTPVLEWGVQADVSGGAVAIGEDGHPLTQEELHEPPLTVLAQMAFGPELTHWGSIEHYWLFTLIAVFNMVQICFPHFFFRMSLWPQVRNVDEAEPSDFYIMMEKIEWLVLTGVCLLGYWYAIRAGGI